MKSPLAMRKQLQFIGLVLALLVSSVAFGQDGEIPKRPTKAMVLEAGVDKLSSAQEASLNAKLIAYNDSTSTQIAILVVNNLGGRDVAEYGQQVGETWGVGQAGRDNGVVIVVAIDERDWTLQSGYGVEGALPDGVLGDIGRRLMRPHFQKGNFYAGLNAATDEIMARMSGEYTALPPQQPGFKVGLLILFIIILIVFLFAKFGDKGGGNFTNLNRSGQRSGRYGSPWFIPGAGGFGGGGGGGGFGGGGFGGFGGGGFGGGGASGGW